MGYGSRMRTQGDEGVHGSRVIGTVLVLRVSSREARNEMSSSCFRSIVIQADRCLPVIDVINILTDKSSECLLHALPAHSCLMPNINLYTIHIDRSRNIYRL